MANKNERTDVLIVGAGISGLSLALYLSEQSEKHKIVVMAKGPLELCNTVMAKGGVAAVHDFTKDSFEQHIADTYAAGLKKGEMSVIEEVVKVAPERIKDLIRWGVAFDYNGKDFDLHQEGGHMHQRILHHADYTGKEIHEKLLLAAQQKSNVKLIQNTMGVDFYSAGNRICGLLYLDEINNLKIVHAKAFVLATGGSGQLFAHTTNSKIATADGVAMAARIGAEIKDLQYIQFHPTAIYKKGAKQLELLTEALRGGGAHLINEKGERFMFAYDEAGELANRAVVSEAIFKELKKSNTDYLYLKLSHLDQKELRHKFPSAYNSCLKTAYDPAKEAIPIVPAAHYQCGGILVDRVGKTNIDNLYAIGECACTNLHGANRLASNSLSEALVYAHNAAQSLGKLLMQSAFDYLHFNDEAFNFEQNPLLLETKENSFEINTKNLQIQIDEIAVELSNIHCGEYTIDNFEETALRLSTLKKQLNKHDFILNKKVAEIRNIVEVSILYLEEKKQSLFAQNSITLENDFIV